MAASAYEAMRLSADCGSRPALWFGRGADWSAGVLAHGADAALPASAHPHTRPPIFSCPAGACTQWEIYDEYIKDLERQRLDEAMKSKGGKKAAAAAAAAGAAHAAKHEHVPTLQSPTLMHSLGTLDRMVNQNMYEEVAMDFKYWDDASDAFR